MLILVGADTSDPDQIPQAAIKAPSRSLDEGRPASAVGSGLSVPALMVADDAGLLGTPERACDHPVRDILRDGIPPGPWFCSRGKSGTEHGDLTGHDQAGPGRQTRTRTSQRTLPVGLVLGWQPILLVPARVHEEDSAIDWVAVFCHELAHWRRLDHLASLAGEILVCVLPWNPLAWWAKTRLSQLAEVRLR